MPKSFTCSKCYRTDDLGLIREFKCSRYGWRQGYARCSCKHHDRDVSLYGLMLARRAA